MKALVLALLLVPIAAYGQEVVTEGSYTDSHGFLRIIGEVQNDTDWPLESVKVKVTVRDYTGTIVGTAHGLADVSTLRPGEKSTFGGPVVDVKRSSEASLIMLQSSDAYSYTITTSGDPADEVNEGALEVSEGDHFVDAIGNYHVVGEITNTGLADTTFVEVSAALYDEAGNILGTVKGFTSPADIAAGATAPFELISLAPNANNTATVGLNVESDDYANVVVPEFPLGIVVLVGSVAALVGFWRLNGRLSGIHER